MTWVTNVVCQCDGLVLVEAGSQKKPGHFRGQLLQHRTTPQSFGWSRTYLFCSFLRGHGALFSLLVCSLPSSLSPPHSLFLTPLSRSGWSYQHNPSFQNFKGACLSLNVLRFKQVALQALSKTALLQRKERRKERSTRFDFIYYAILYQVKYSELTQKQCWVISSRFRILSEGGCVCAWFGFKVVENNFLFQVICF